MTGNDDNYMGRGKAQVLFNHLPGSTFDYDRGFGIHRVTSIRGEQAADLDLQYIGNQIIRRIDQWDKADGSLGTTGFPEYPENFSLLTPARVNTEYFPLLWTCEDCSRAHFYQSSNQLAYNNSDLECDECGGNISQEQFVGFHPCGHVESLAPSQDEQPNSKPGRCSCGELRWKLDTKGSQRLQNFRWVCMNCGNREELSQICGAKCDLENQYLSFNVHRGSNVYQPHYFNLVSVASTGSNRLGSTGEAIAVLAKYFGLSDKSISRIDIEQTQEDTERDELEDLRDTLRERGMDEAADDVEEDLAELDDGGPSIRDGVANFVPQIVDWLDSEDNDDHEFAFDGVQEIYEQLAITNELKTRPAREVILERGDVDLRRRESLEEEAEDVEAALNRHGISGAGLIEDFPVTSVVFGYSRGGREPEEARLISFDADDADLVDGSIEASTTPVFVDTVRTEAVRFELNPSVVMYWLLENSRQPTDLGETLREQIQSSSLPDSREVPVPEDWSPGEEIDWASGDGTAIETESLSEWSEDEIRAWLLENIAPIPEYDTITITDPTNVVSYFVYHLVHSFSHQVLKYGTSLIGMERTSISEYLLPRSLSFIVYTNQRTDFSLGGMHALVESGLEDLLDEIQLDGDDCVYDPVCSRGGSTCFNCMFVSEVSCGHLNRNLGRDFLFGSRQIADRDLTGYLEVAEKTNSGAN